MTPIQEAECLLLELHDMMRFGHGDTDEADAIRDALDPVVRKLSSSDRRLINDLSGDLYLLEGEFQPKADDPEPAMPVGPRAYKLHIYWRDQGLLKASRRFEEFWLRT